MTNFDAFGQIWTIYASESTIFGHCVMQSFSVGHTNIKNVNGVPGSSSTTATSASLGGGSYNNHVNGGGDHFRRTMFQSNGNGLATNSHVESSNMLISMATPPSGNGRRPAAGRGYNRNFCLNLQRLHFWLLLWEVQLPKGTWGCVTQQIMFRPIRILLQWPVSLQSTQRCWMVRLTYQPPQGHHVWTCLNMFEHSIRIRFVICEWSYPPHRIQKSCDQVHHNQQCFQK